MIARVTQGWQVVLADLALILFITTTAALVGQHEAEERVLSQLASAAMPERGEPVAIWRAETGGPDLADYLASQPDDPRMVLSILSRHGPQGSRAAAINAAERLAGGLGAGQWQVRIIVERGEDDELVALLAFDADAAMAQSLQDQAQDHSSKGPS